MMIKTNTGGGITHRALSAAVLAREIITIASSPLRIVLLNLSCRVHAQYGSTCALHISAIGMHVGRRSFTTHQRGRASSSSGSGTATILIEVAVEELSRYHEQLQPVCYCLFDRSFFAFVRPTYSSSFFSVLSVGRSVCLSALFAPSLSSVCPCEKL